MKRNILCRYLCVLTVLTVILSGCGLSKKQETVSDMEQPTVEVETQSDDTKNEASSEDTEVSGSLGKHVSDAADVADQISGSLAERLCGKYSYKDDNEEYQILEICEFADNLYAYYGLCMEEEEGVEPEELYAYSFYALELIPDNEEDVRSETADSADVNILAFSVMSNLSKYQAPPEKCNITLKDGGIDLTSAFFTGANETVFFERDDRVEDAFPYIKDPDAGRDIDIESLTGLWRQTADTVIDKPYYLDFKDNGEMKIYQEVPGTEVTFGCGSYFGTEDDELGFRCSFLGQGGMPYEFHAEWSADNSDELVLDFSYSDITVFDKNPNITFERIDETDVPIVTIDEVKKVLTDDHVYDMYAETEPDAEMLDEFYGVWISAFEQSDDATDLVEKLKKAGFDATYVYSPEWKNLSPKSFYCVTAGMCETKDEADELLTKVKEAGYKDAYVKSTGERLIR